MEKKRSRSSEIFAYIIMSWLVLVILGTLTGVWIKLFWIEWVLR